MRSFRCYLEIGIALCVLALLVGCAASPMQKGDQLAMSNPEAAIGAYKQVMETKPGKADAQKAHLKIADTYYKRMNNQEKGLEVYEEVVKAYPKTEYSGEANYALGMHYFQAKDYERARQYFAKVNEDIPGTEKASDAALLIGKCYEELKKFEDAAKLYEDFSKTHPQHRLAAQAGLTAAKIYDRELENSDKAVEAYKRVATDYSLSSSGREARDALTEMGVDMSEVATPPGAETPASQAEAQTPTRDRGRRRATNIPRAEIGGQQRSEEQLSRTVSPDFGVDPLDVMPNISVDSQGTMYDAMFMFANMNLQSGDYKAAGALYEKAIALGDSPTKPWENAAQAYFGLGKAYKGIGREDKAKQMFLEAIKRDRKVIDSMIVSGETYYSNEEYQEALEAYKLAIGLVPYKDSEIYYKIGLVYQKLGDTDKELEAFERAVALKPSDTDAVQHLAEVLYYRKKDATRANLYDTEAKGQGNNDYKVQRELGDLCYKYESYSWAKIKYSNAARLILRKIDEDLKKAIAAGNAAEVKLVVEDPAKLNLKFVYQAADSGNQLALEALSKVAPLIADYRLVSSRVVISNAMSNQLVEAQKQLDAFKNDDPKAVDSAEFHYALGVLTLAKGDKVNGLAEVKKALEIDPKHKEAADKLKQLESQGASPTGTSG